MHQRQPTFSILLQVRRAFCVQPYPVPLFPGGAIKRPTVLNEVRVGFAIRTMQLLIYDALPAFL